MAPIRNVPLGVVGAAIAVALYGCDLAAMTNGLAEVACKHLVEQGIEKVAEGVGDHINQTCHELKDVAMKQGLNDEKATQLHDKCLDAAGMRVTEDAEEQNTNYTEQCIHAIKNATSGQMSQLNSLVEEVMKNLNMTTELHGMIQGHVTDTLKDLGKQYNITLPADLLGAEEKVEQDAGNEEKKDEEKDEKKEEGEEEDEKKDPAPAPAPAPAHSRLFDGSISTIGRGAGSSVLACFFGGALVAAVGLVAMLRRRPSSAALRKDDHEVLIAEDSEPAEA